MTSQDSALPMATGEAVYQYLRGFTGNTVPLPSPALLAGCIRRATDMAEGADPVAYRLATGRIVHQTYGQRWVNTDGYPLALVPDLADAVALYYTEDPQ